MERVNPGIGSSDLDRRLASVERVLSGFRKETLYSRRPDGVNEQWAVLAAREGTADAYTDTSACQFGSIYESGGTWYARGGTITAGPDNYAVADDAFTPPAEGASTLLWVVVDFEANSEDGVLLPGIDSSSAPTFAGGAAYPDNTIPTSADPTGKVIIPVGTVTTTAGVPVLVYAGVCGAVTVTHCPGVVSYSAA